MVTFKHGKILSVSTGRYSDQKPQDSTFAATQRHLPMAWQEAHICGGLLCNENAEFLLLTCDPHDIR